MSAARRSAETLSCRAVRRVRLEARAVGPERGARHSARHAVRSRSPRPNVFGSTRSSGVNVPYDADASVAYRAAKRSSSSGGYCGAEKPRGSPSAAWTRETRFRPRNDAPRRPTAREWARRSLQSCANSRKDGKTIAGAGARRSARMVETASSQPRDLLHRPREASSRPPHALTLRLAAQNAHMMIAAVTRLRYVGDGGATFSPMFVVTAAPPSTSTCRRYR